MPDADPVSEPVGHGDQADRPAPDQRDDVENAATEQAEHRGDSSSNDGTHGEASVPDKPIAGTEPQPSEAAHNPNEAETPAAGRDI